MILRVSREMPAAVAVDKVAEMTVALGEVSRHVGSGRIEALKSVVGKDTALVSATITAMDYAKPGITSGGSDVS
jgi:hypothetical protein